VKEPSVLAPPRGRARRSPLVSIVTPSLNQGSFIREAVESVLAQDYTNLEYLVIDGGSTDGTVEILRDYGDCLSWVSEPDRGQSHAINKGWRRARGEILAWLNSDDKLLPGAVSIAVEALQADREAAVAYGDLDEVDRDGQLIRTVSYGDFDRWTLLHVYNPIPQPAAFIRRTALEEVGYVDEQLNYVMDWDLWMRIAKRKRIIHVPARLAVIRAYPDTKSQTGGYRQYREVVRILRRHREMRFPPGIAARGLDTSRFLLRRWIIRHTPRAARQTVSRLLHGAGASVRRLVRAVSGRAIE